MGTENKQEAELKLQGLNLIRDQINNFFVKHTGVFADAQVFVRVGLQAHYKLAVLKNIEFAAVAFMMQVLGNLELHYLPVFFNADFDLFHIVLKTQKKRYCCGC